MSAGDPINRGMQRHILAAVLQDHGLFGQAASVLNPDYFTDESTSDIIAWATSQWRVHKQVPSKAALLDAFKEESRREVIKRAFLADVTDKKYTIKRIADYAQDRAMRLAIRSVAEHMAACDAGNPPTDKKGKPVELDAVGLVRKAMSVGSSLQGMGKFLDELVDDISDKILHPQHVDLFTTGSEHLDQCGLRLARGEIGCIVAKAKGGKSQALLNIALSNAAQGRNVIYYNVEIKEDRLNERFARRIAGKKVDMKTDPVEFVRKFKERFPKLVTGRILMQRYYAGCQTFDDIRIHIDQCRANGFNPDLIIVDYVGLMKTNQSFDAERHRLEAVWKEFRGLCAEYDVGGWGAAQANRTGAKAELVHGTDIGECYPIIAHIDAGFSLNMTDEEAEQQIGRIYILASRNSKDGVIINYTHDFSRSILQTTGVATPEAKPKNGSRKPTTDEDNEQAQFNEARERRAKKPTLEDRQ